MKLAKTDSLWLSLFISALDTTIITTSLIKISSSFDALERGAWLITTYLLTYNAFIMISANMSDIFGLKFALVACCICFLIFSLACGGAQTMVQLIVFRAFQGIGGSGLYSLVFVAIIKLITPEKASFYSGVISSCFAIANTLGPVLGGVISDRSSWRWIFFMNGPIVGTALVILFFSMPGLGDGESKIERLRGFDAIGGVLSVCWPIPLIFALQEGGVRYAWSSAIILGTLIAGLAGLLIFGIYEAWIPFRTKKDAVFPIKFFTNPSMVLLLLCMFLLGMPFYVAVIQLPQRFQAVNGTSAERAGILLLPVTLMTPFGAMLGGLLMGRKIAAEYLLILSTGIASVGIGLLSSLPTSVGFWPGTYAYEIITGLGLGLASPVYYFLLYTSVEDKDIAVGTGALNMLRTLGGCVAVAICSAIHNTILDDRLPSILPSSQSALIENFDRLDNLPPGVKTQLGEIFGHSYNRQFQAILGFSLLNFVVAIGLAVVRKRMGIFGIGPSGEQWEKYNQERAAKTAKKHADKPELSNREIEEKRTETTISPKES
ncbi:MFS general substrate transporter [Westerdykella ornata]|uniref:MFS general substrate transporter n=1 Tax=Westerdykella ornata TaxID=318751 RepID=A0A6A6JW92_WESOR|nr:MFS general substrate transporter [Westerdykella ornata]KAF2280872.1 MFS general substrate transporter [Westerdykella ornata]